jgi:hypothetical protein
VGIRLLVEKFPTADLFRGKTHHTITTGKQIAASMLF